MTRTAPLACLLFVALATGPLARAQDDAPSATPTPAAAGDPRIVLDASATLDKQPSQPNGLQYFIYERLNAFRFRIDSKQEIGQKKLDEFVAKMDRYWKKKDPEGTQPVDLTLTVKQETVYDGSKFYGEIQAHNFDGRITAELKDKDGKVVETFGFSFNWGRSKNSGLTKRQVQNLYDGLLAKALTLGLLNHPALKSRIPAKFHPELLKWSKEVKKDLLELLEGSTETIKKGEMATFVRKVELEGEKQEK